MTRDVQDMDLEQDGKTPARLCSVESVNESLGTRTAVGNTIGQEGKDLYSGCVTRKRAFMKASEREDVVGRKDVIKNVR
jgi:uncharacterized ParB-like nuclease family protein